jgi:benzoyl-CoA reductase/2-hydroxyglutaryl-CoA dehydratase subunit BcrC/BadD/HgdB
MINPCHWGCRQGTGSRGLITQELQKAGIPVLNLEVDCVDPRNFSEGQVRTRIQAFVETILARKARAY